MKTWIAGIFAVAALTAALPASAQTAFSPKKASISDLIQPATYDRVPIKIQEYPLLGTKSVVNEGRLDFELSYDVTYWDMISWLEASFKDKKSVSLLDPDIFPNAKAPELRVYGKSGNGEQMKFTLGNPDLPYRFDLRIRPDDQSKAVVIVQNAVYSLIYSGGMPARAPFKPAGKTKPIRFRWN